MNKLGFGFMRLPLLDGLERTSIDYSTLSKMVDYFINNGFSYFDTGYAYHNGESEKALKKVVVDRYDRKQFQIADKMPLFMIRNKEQMSSIFNEQLRRCGVTFFDYYLLHAVGNANYPMIKEIEAFKFLKHKQSMGNIRHIGISYHDKADLLEEILLNHPEIEVVQLQINYVDWDDPVIESRKCYEVAEKYGKKIIVMEPVKGGVLANVPSEVEEIFKQYDVNSTPASWALRYVASKPQVMLILSGMSSFAQMNENVATIKNFKTMNEEEDAILESAKALILKSIEIPCTSCHYCTKNCPKGINIPEYFAIYNNLKKFQISQKLVASIYFNNLQKKSARISECIGCKECESVCPQHIEITSKLKEVYYELSRQSILSTRKIYKSNLLQNKKQQ